VALVHLTLVAICTAVKAGLVALTAFNTVEPLICRAHAWTEPVRCTPCTVSCHTTLPKIDGAVLKSVDEPTEEVDASVVAAEEEVIVLPALDQVVVVELGPIGKRLRID
jgi:hypothetical protein